MPPRVHNTGRSEIMKRRALILTVTVLVWCAGSVVFGQSREELRRKYGDPISETFLVRPGIGVTVTYSNTGRITEIMISPQTTDLIKSKGKSLNKDAVKAILEELVPKSDRGKFLIGTFENIICLPDNDCQGTSEAYEKVTIYFNSGTEGGVNYAVLRWK
jgi:hypothetical protein